MLVGSRLLPRRVAPLLAIAALVFGWLPDGAAGAAPLPGDHQADTWRFVPAATQVQDRAGHTAVWTGSEMIVWGGVRQHGRVFVSAPPLGDGGRLDPAHPEAWRPVATAGAPFGRTGHTAVWTGSEMIVWGGAGPYGPPLGNREMLGDGGRYDPAADRWQPTSANGAPSPRFGHAAVWTGREMLVWGGYDVASGTFPSDGARYDPASNTWRPIAQAGAPGPRSGFAAVWTGQELLVWGDKGTSGVLGNGGAYNPISDTWRSIPVVPGASPTPRDVPTGVWTGRDLVVWGGLDAAGRPLGDGGVYDPAANAWRSLPAGSPNEPAARLHHTAIWTGSEMIVWGGETGAGGPARGFADGARYDPATDRWTPVAGGAPGTRWNHTAVWAGDEMLVWGGYGGYFGDTVADGGRYFPVAAGAPPLPAPPPVLHDERYFAETGYRIDDDRVWDYFLRRGRVQTFGYPVSRTFTYMGCRTQIFQRQLAQVCGDGPARFMNLLDPELFPYSPDGGTRVNGSTFPAPDPALKQQTPSVNDPAYGTTILEFVRNNAPDDFEGEPVRFGATFFGSVTPEMAGTDDPAILGLLGLEVWGAPISRPARDPNNAGFIYQRFQRGIMHYDATTGVTGGILLADYFKQILRNSAELPPDLREQSIGNRHFAQYCPGGPGWLCRIDDLPATDLTFSFERG